MPEAIWIGEADVTAAADLAAAVAAVRSSLGVQARGLAIPLDKTAVSWAGGDTLHALGGVDTTAGVVGTKTWAHTSNGATPLLVLWDAADGALLAVVEAFALGQLRTAAVSAVATDALAPAATAMAMIGSGKQALAQVAAVLQCRPIQEVRVFSPTPEHRHALAGRVSVSAPEVKVFDVDSVAEAVAGAGVVTTATRARHPVLRLQHVDGDVHVNALGSITRERRELADDLVQAASLVASDAPDTARALSSELDRAATVVSLAELVAAGGTRPDGITVFKAMGLGLADVAVGAAVLAAVQAAGGGRPIPAPRRSTPTLFRRPTSGGQP